ncbi:MAG: glycosyltransferase family 4 protein [Anaerolineales bacterium]|nr:glycosyltransferase family 4 protein [Anaerolineales bacterium]
MSKIAILHYSAPPVVGGVESVLAHHARLLAQDGHRVMILAGRGEQGDPHITMKTTPLMDSRHPDILSVKRILDGGSIPDEFSCLVDKISRTLNENLMGLDWVIAHNIASMNKNLPLTLALKAFSEKPGAPRMILWHHDLAWCTPRYQSELYPGFPWDLLKTHWQTAIQVVVSTLRQGELANLYGIPPDQIHVIPNGLNIKQFLKLEDKTAAFIEQLNLMAAHPLLLLPVRITTRKNIEMALRTLYFLKQKFPQAVLVVTGPLGPHNPANLDYFSRLLALREDLHLVGAAHFLAELSESYLEDAVIADFYRLADALLFPSMEEGFGIPVLEAGLSGIPIFCSDIPPLRELGGTMVKYFSVSSEPNQVADMIYDQLSNDLQFNLRVSVRTRYTWDNIYKTKIAPLFMI